MTAGVSATQLVDDVRQDALAWARALDDPEIVVGQITRASVAALLRACGDLLAAEKLRADTAAKALDEYRRVMRVTLERSCDQRQAAEARAAKAGTYKVALERARYYLTPGRTLRVAEARDAIDDALAAGGAPGQAGP